MPSLWLLNLDADLELARPERYEPTAGVAAAVDEQRPRARRLLAPEDLELLPGEPPPERARGLPGRAWCMTPRARRLLREAEAEPVDAPPLAVLQRVNARAFAHALGLGPEEARCNADPDDVERHLASRPMGEPWLAKRAHGMAGRGQRRLSAGRLSGVDRDWLENACGEGRVLLERRRELVLETVVHGLVDADGELRLGPIREQRTDASGAWSETRAAAELARAERELLLDAAAAAGGALTRAGYFGPFGLDAYAWIEGGGRRWNPASDLNARFTMGWSGGGLRPVVSRRQGPDGESENSSDRYPRGTRGVVLRPEAGFELPSRPEREVD